MHEYLSIHPEVAAALAARRPVVALESTIISHGMPYPRNVETAREVEAIVRAGGAVPATIAVIDGRIRVGLGEDDLELLATAPDVRKVSRRDFGMVLASRVLGATTVAGTMIGARLAGISVFVTGGIGGVHRGDDMDVSADLDELAQTPVAVVCAGAKSILDLPRTLEYLETRGVPVLGWRTDEFPAFYAPRSGLPVAHRADDAATVAQAMRAQWALGLKGGLVVAAPIPTEHALDAGTIGATIAQALSDAALGGVRGKDVTPFLLARIQALTGGASLTANIELVKNNARVGTEIAVAYAQTAPALAAAVPSPRQARKRAP